MKYRNYEAFIRYVEGDKIFVGKVAGIEDVICFHGTSVKGLEKAFHKAVNDYLSHCKKIKKVPEKGFSGRFCIHTQPKIHRVLSIQAQAAGHNLNEFVVEKLVGVKKA